MSWIGLYDRESSQFNPTGLDANTLVPGSHLPRGTLLIEFAPAHVGKIVDLLSLNLNATTVLRIKAIPDAGYALITEQNGRELHTLLKWRPSRRTESVRLSYIWDLANNRAELRLTEPGHQHSQHVSAPMATRVTLDAVREFFVRSGRKVASHVEFCALSVACEPTDTLPTLTPDTPIETGHGTIPVHKIIPNMRVSKGDGQLTRVLQNVQRKMPARGSFRPITLFAPYFGLRKDITVSPDQRIVLRGSDVEYTFGSEAVLAEARHLANGKTGEFAKTNAIVRYHQLLLTRNEIMVSAGAEIESQFIGRMRRRSALLAASPYSVIDPSGLPEHAGPQFPILCQHEVTALLQNRAA
ncbi:MAG: Hint domain-containing protein [Paracoccaceae bacterium]